MTSSPNFKSAELVKPGVSASFGNESDALHGLRRKAKLGCLVIGIPCFGLLFVMSLLLVVSGVAALWIGNMDSEDDLPEFFHYPLHSAGTIMVLSGVAMLVGLIWLWYTTEKRNPLKRKSKRVPYLYSSNSYQSAVTGTSISRDELTSYPIAGTLCHLGHGNVTPRQMVDCPPSEPDQLPPYPEESECPMSYSSAPSRSQMLYPSAPPESQNMSYPSAPSKNQMLSFEGRMSYPTQPSECQIPYTPTPPASQTSYTNPSIGQMNPLTGNSIPYSRQYDSSTEQMFHLRALTSEQMTLGLPVRYALPREADPGFADEMPPPYTP